MLHIKVKPGVVYLVNYGENWSEPSRVWPGGSFRGMTYEELCSLGDGRHDRTPPGGHFIDGQEPEYESEWHRRFDRFEFTLFTLYFGASATWEVLQAARGLVAEGSEHQPRVYRGSRFHGRGPEDGSEWKRLFKQFEIALFRRRSSDSHTQEVLDLARKVIEEELRWERATAAAHDALVGPEAVWFAASAEAEAAKSPKRKPGVDEMTRPHSMKMKYLLAQMALQDAERFFAKFGPEGDFDYLMNLWTAVGLDFPPEERVSMEGLAPWHRSASDGAPEMLVLTLPRPVGRNEPYFLAVVRLETGPARVFCLERTAAADDVETAVLVEFSAGGRANWGAGPGILAPLFAEAVVRLCRDPALRPFSFIPIALA